MREVFMLPTPYLFFCSRVCFVAEEFLYDVLWVAYDFSYNFHEKIRYKSISEFYSDFKHNFRHL